MNNFLNKNFNEKYIINCIFFVYLVNFIFFIFDVGREKHVILDDSSAIKFAENSSFNFQEAYDFIKDDIEKSNKSDQDKISKLGFIIDGEFFFPSYPPDKMNVLNFRGYTINPNTRVVKNKKNEHVFINLPKNTVGVKVK